jgi:hypothetical protein
MNILTGERLARTAPVRKRRPAITTTTPDVTEYVVHWRTYTARQVWLAGAEVYACKDKMLREIYAGAVNTVQRVISYNAAEGWAHDVSADVAQEIADRFNSTGDSIERSLINFLHDHLGVESTLELNTEE